MFSTQIKTFTLKTKEECVYFKFNRICSCITEYKKNTHKGLSLQEHDLIASEYSLILHKYKQSYR